MDKLLEAYHIIELLHEELNEGITPQTDVGLRIEQARTIMYRMLRDMGVF